uniref:Eukaryotic translation initiation factor 4C n=1 Tax=Equus asinus TaxID=9793 RepID=A0A9L0I9D1_EQUAS
MPKNKGKGGKTRRRGKNKNESEKRELVFKEEGQEYAQVIKMLGNGRLEALCFDGVKRLCHIRGKLRKKVWINTSDIILVGLRDYQASCILAIVLDIPGIVASKYQYVKYYWGRLTFSLFCGEVKRYAGIVWWFFFFFFLFLSKIGP